MMDNSGGKSKKAVSVCGNGSLWRGRDLGREGREREGERMRESEGQGERSEGCTRQCLYFRDSRPAYITLQASSRL